MLDCQHLHVAARSDYSTDIGRISVDQTKPRPVRLCSASEFDKHKLLDSAGSLGKMVAGLKIMGQGHSRKRGRICVMISKPSNAKGTSPSS